MKLKWIVRLLIVCLVIVNIANAKRDGRKRYPKNEKSLKKHKKKVMKNRTESFNIADILQDTITRLHVMPRDTRSAEELLKLYDPEDFLLILPDMPLAYDPMVAINTLGGLFDSFQNPQMASMKGNMTEAYTYTHNGRKMAYGFCINTGRAADGTVLYIVRVMQIWRKYGNDWKLHRDYGSFEQLA